MSLLEQQHFLAKLYTNENFRQQFIEEPKKIGKENNLTDNEIAVIIEIFPEEIEAFAESLFYKRLREVERFLPLTRKVLDADFEKLFRDFIKEFNPQTVKKHLEDAVEFAKFVQKNQTDKLWIKDIAKLEQAKLEFGGIGKNFIVKKFDFDIRNLHHNNTPEDLSLNKRKSVAIWVRIGKYHKHFIL